MIKFKRLAFITIMGAATLLALGNLTTLAQANNADIVTPTPTGTPFADPNGQGEPVPEEVKAVIEAYFEIRYRALSVSDADDFKQNGFGDLIADAQEAGVFLQEELGKLAVEIKHAELNRIRYAHYQYFLDFSNFAVDTSSQLATISVVEGHEVIDEISMEFSPEDPLVSQRSNLEHTIVLRREQDQWKIVSDNYTDYLWRMLRETGISTDEILNGMQAMPRPLLQSESVETATASPLPADTSIHAYDRLGAVQYALDHWGGIGASYNPDYPIYTGLGGDCTNFVSQAIYEGGNASMFIPSPLPPPDPGGQSGWYLLNEGQRASAWNDVGAFYTFVTDPSYSWQDPYPGGEWWGEGPTGYAVAINELMLGDVIQYDWDANGVWDHAAIVVNFVGADPYVATHTPDDAPRHYTAFAPAYNPNVSQIRYIHIERSNGYSPVKAEISQGSDDAGTHTVLPSTCAFSVSANEIYFGACFGSGASITSGFRFNNILIPKNTPIKYAYMNFTVDGTYTAPLNLQIYGENTGNSVTFSAGSQPTSRPTFPTPVPWNITNTWNSGVRQNSPLLTSVVQSIINHPNWASGNSLSVIFKNNGPTSGNPWPVRRVFAYERANPDPSTIPSRLIATHGLATVTTAPTYNSLGTQDGWILESTETSEVGGSINSSATSFRLGDDAADKQYRSILHFNTGPNLPDNAVITSVTLKIKQQGSITGTNPFTTHDVLLAAIQKPSFGAASLATGDFQAPPVIPDPATPGRFDIAAFDSIPSAPSSGWYTALLRSDAFPHINLTGTTQFRLYFMTGDNDDLSADYMAFSSGNNGTAANRPQLIVSYYLPP